MELLAKGEESFDTDYWYRKKRDFERAYEWYVAYGEGIFVEKKDNIPASIQCDSSWFVMASKSSKYY